MKKTLRKIIAKLRGTFVSDCPLCHMHFCGYHNYAEQVNVNGKHYRIICHRCFEKNQK